MSIIDKEMKMVSGVIDLAIIKLRNQKSLILDGVTWEQLEDIIENHITTKYSELAISLYNSELSNDEIYDMLKILLAKEVEQIIRESV